MNPIITPQRKAMEEARRLIRREVSARYEAERKHAVVWRQLVILLKIEREVQKELKRRFPPGALYIGSSVR